MAAPSTTSRKPQRRRRIRLGTTVVLAALLFFVAVVNLSIHRAFNENTRDQKSIPTNTNAFATSTGKAAAANNILAPRSSAQNTKSEVSLLNTKAPSSTVNTGIADAIATADDHPIAGLNCVPHGGPADSNDPAENEMVFWEDVPIDSKYRSPFLRDDRPQYLTFEPDHGGFNNIRMAMETVLVMAHAMGRILVLPPEKKMYLLGKDAGKHRTEFTFNDFFHLDSIAVEHEGFNVITTEEFLKREGMTGNLRNTKTGEILKPPGNSVDWNGKELAPLERYLRTVGVFPQGWNPDECVCAIPTSRDPKHVAELQEIFDDIMQGKYGPVPDNDKDYAGKPTPVDAPVADRLREMLGGRKKLCIYDEQLQNVPLIHMSVQHGTDSKSRLLTHFYAFLFFQSFMDDLYYKRFVRDHVRYIDEIVCAAARVVAALRERVRGIGDNPGGIYDSMHIRRGDFQYKKTRISAEEIYERSKNELADSKIIFVATDERDKTFFEPLRKHYTLFFLDDFVDQIKGINSNYYGMIDQLIASRGRVFFGTWWSTLSGYINRMRGYSSQKKKLDGYLDGTLQSFYFVPEEKKYQMTVYKPVKLPIYMREFPAAWRDIDRNIADIHDENIRQKQHQLQ